MGAAGTHGAGQSSLAAGKHLPFKGLNREPLQKKEEETAKEAMFATSNEQRREEEVRMANFYNNAPGQNLCNY